MTEEVSRAICTSSIANNRHCARILKAELALTSSRLYVEFVFSKLPAMTAVQSAAVVVALGCIGLMLYMAAVFLPRLKNVSQCFCMASLFVTSDLSLFLQECAMTYMRG